MCDIRGYGVSLKIMIQQDYPRNIIAFLQDMNSEEEVRCIPTWKALQLTGDRKGTWSLFVSRNWRITFAINNDGIEIIDLDFEDYH